MKRSKFLASVGLGFMAVPFAITVSKNDSTDACTPTARDTPGPFTTHEPDTLIRKDIRADRTGIPLDMELTILDRNNGCQPMAGVIVDVWHCDKDGLYSEYGEHRLQKTDMREEHFLRGRQTTDSNGKVAFTSIFPGWYTSRSTHIHYEVKSADGKSLMISQIAFPEGKDSAVAQVNSASDKGYTKGMSGFVVNSKDGVFRDGVETQLGHISGSVEKGFGLTHTIIV